MLACKLCPAFAAPANLILLCCQLQWSLHVPRSECNHRSLIPFWLTTWLLCLAGYGYTTPLSDAGKAFCIFYALLGVPFTMLMLTATVQHLVSTITSGPLEYLVLRRGWSRRAVSCGHLFLLLAVVLGAFFLVPAAIFSTLEESWSYLDAFYFCFISLCTIGLGDYVPGEQSGQRLRPLYKVSITGEARGR